MQQRIVWPGLGRPMGTTKFLWVVGVNAGPAANDENVDPK